MQSHTPGLPYFRVIRPGNLHSHEAGTTHHSDATPGERAMQLFNRDPRKKLEKVYQQKMEAAMDAMRRGDIRGNAELVTEAEKIRLELEKLAQQIPGSGR